MFPRQSRKSWILWFFLWALPWMFLLCTAAGAEAPSRSPKYVAIEPVTVLDGSGGPALKNARVLIQDGRIAAIEGAQKPLKSGVQRIDGQSGYLLPGFIDMHAHLLFPRAGENKSIVFDRPLSEKALGVCLDYGITSVRSPATPTVEGLRFRDDLNAGRVRGPRAMASAELINDPNLKEESLRRLVRDALPYRPDYFKVYAPLEPSQVGIVVDEAHRHGIPVIGHLQKTSWLEGLSLGVDHLAHAVDWSPKSLPQSRQSSYQKAVRNRAGFRARIDWLEHFDPNSEEARKLALELSRQGVSVDVTLVAYDGKFSPPGTPQYWKNAALDNFPELRQQWQRGPQPTSDWTAEDFTRWKAAWPKLLGWVSRMSQSGVLIVTGTDLTNEWVIPGESLHREFELLAEAGLSPEKILRMTGVDAAKALRRSDIGRIAVGCRADLVLLRTDPRHDIRRTRNIAWVMQGGQLVSKGR